jgi:putative ABC transport system ATP-binding protein
METAIVIDDQYSSAQDESRTDSAPEPESTDSNVIVELKNIHKTYLLGIEGVPALR